jgi:hypothetical protein
VAQRPPWPATSGQINIDVVRPEANREVTAVDSVVTEAPVLDIVTLAPKEIIVASATPDVVVGICAVKDGHGFS